MPQATGCALVAEAGSAASVQAASGGVSAEGTSPSCCLGGAVPSRMVRH